MAARDPLELLHRVRQRAVDDASAILSDALARERQAADRCAMQEDRIRREQAQAGLETHVFAQWLPHARLQLAQMQAALRAAQSRTAHCRNQLTEHRLAAEAVAKAMERQRAERALVAARREQAVMDEAAGRRGGMAFP